MPTVVCHHCSQIFTVNGPKPDQCPSCGKTLHIEGDPTPSGPALHSTVIHIGDRNPTAFGRYVVQSRLGAGGFGTVFLAKDPQLDRPVAIKVPRGETGRSPLGRERFAREARSIAQLRHPNIVSVFDVELDGEPPFIVCDYIEGETLSDRLKKDPLSFREAAQLIADVATAVDYAHKSGIVHRDIKPSNIMIDSTGKPRLMDFGLAKRETIDHTVTTGHAILGTPAYMPPEQAWGGKRGTVDRRSDVYSLGTVLYQLLTRELPFRGEPRMVLRQVIEDDPKSPRTLNAEIPRDLETICEKAMQKEPGNRYQTARALADDLNHWLRDEPIEARPVTRLERSWRWCRRNPTAAGLLVSLVLLPIILALCAVVVAGKERKAADASAQLAQVEKSAHASAEVAKQHAVEKADELARLNQELREMVSKSYVARGSEYLRPNDTATDYSPLKALPWFEAAMEIDDNHPTRRDASRLRMGALLRSTPSVKRAWSHGSSITVLAVSPAGDHFFTGSHDGTGRLWSPSQDAPIGPALNHPANISAATFSADGKSLLTACADGALRLWETAGGRLAEGPRQVPQIASPSGPPATIRGVAFSRDGQMVLAVSGQSAHVFEVKGLKPVGKPFGARDGITTAEFADSARLIVTKSRGGTLSVWDVQTGAEKLRLGKPSRWDAFGVAAEGPIVVAAQSADSLALWNCTTGKLAVPARLAHADKVFAVRFSADGTRLATGTSDGTVSLWNVEDGRLLWRARPSCAEIRRFEFLKQGSRLAVLCNDSPDQWACVLECRHGTLIGEPLHFHLPVLLTQGLREVDELLTTSVDGTIRLWRTESADSAFPLPISSDIRGAAVSADRRAVVAFAREGTAFILRAGEGHLFSQKAIQKFQIEDWRNAAAISFDGSRIAFADEGSTATILDARSGRKISSRLEHNAPISRLYFTPDGNLLIAISRDLAASSTKTTLTSWDARSGERRQQLDVAAQITDLDIRRTDNLCVVAAADRVLLWNPISGSAPRFNSTAVNGLAACRFSPDGRLILAGGADGLSRVWDVASLKQLASTSKMQGIVTCLGFSPNGASFVTCYKDGTARIWGAADALPASGTLVHGAAPSFCLFSSDSRWLVTVSDGGQFKSEQAVTLVRGWDARTGELVFTRAINRLDGRFPQDLGVSSKRAWRIAAVFFGPDDRQFHVLTVGGLFVTLDLHPDLRPLADVSREVKIRSGALFDRRGGLSFDGPNLLSSTPNIRE